MSVEKHLGRARKYFGQNRVPDAIFEYRQVLALDAQNKEALSALQSLTNASAEPTLTESGRIKTNFLAHQSEETATPITRQPPLMVLFGILALAGLFGLYQLVMYFVNYDKNIAMKYVEVHLQKPVQKDGIAYVNVEIDNYNPQDVQDVTFNYQINGLNGSSLASGNVTIPTLVPAGDQRTFSNVKLTPLSEQANRMHADLTNLRLGDKPGLSPALANKFIEAAALKPQDAVAQFTELVKSAPDFGPGYTRLGQALLANEDYDRADKAFAKAIKINSDDANAHYHLGVAYFYKGNRDGARHELSTASRLCPDDPVIADALKQASAGPAHKQKSADTAVNSAKEDAQNGQTDIRKKEHGP